MTINGTYWTINCGFLATKCVDGVGDKGLISASFLFKDDKVKIPKKITILGRTFKVFNNLTQEQMTKRIGDGSCPMGATNYSMREILILKHQNKNEQIVTLLHEINHIIQMTSGENQTMTAREVEIDCEIKAQGFYDAFMQMK